MKAERLLEEIKRAALIAGVGASVEIRSASTIQIEILSVHAEAGRIVVEASADCDEATFEGALLKMGAVV